MENTANMTITIKKDGRIESTITGMKGTGCMAIDEFLTKLGTTTVTKTREFYENSQEKQKIVRLG
jgi:hypothetical protein